MPGHSRLTIKTTLTAVVFGLVLIIAGIGFMDFSPRSA